MSSDNNNHYLSDSFLQDCREQYRTPIPVDVMSNVNPYELKVFSYYAMICTLYGYCHESDKLISRVIKVSVNLVARSRKSLTKKGYICSDMRYSDKYGNVVSYITVPFIKNTSSYMHNYKITDARRLNIYHRDNFTCQNPFCSFQDLTGALLHLDHILPTSRGGLNNDTNLQTLCHTCNVKKSDKTMIEWMQELENQNNG